MARKTTLKKPKTPGPLTLDLVFTREGKMPRTYRHVTSYGISEGALVIHSDDGAYRYHTVIMLSPGDTYEVDLSNLPREAPAQ